MPARKGKEATKRPENKTNIESESRETEREIFILHFVQEVCVANTANQGLSSASP